MFERKLSTINIIHFKMSIKMNCMIYESCLRKITPEYNINIY